MLLKNSTLFFNQLLHPSITVSRNVNRIPHWEYHIRFDPKVGRKRPAQDVLDRFKRLHNGIFLNFELIVLFYYSQFFSFLLFKVLKEKFNDCFYCEKVEILQFV